MAEFRYLAFGLSLTSEIALPELMESRDVYGGPADVTIRLGEAPADLEGARPAGPGALAREGAYLLDVAAARYLVRAGGEIIVEAKAGGAERDLRGYLLGSALGAICHQRGLLPLHANAIVGDRGAVAFAGPSGAGKSTLAAYFLERSRRVLCDDVCVLTFEAGGLPIAWPGVARIKLWDDALAAFGRDAEGLERVWEGEEKYSLPIPPNSSLDPVHLKRLYILKGSREADEPVVERLSGRPAFEAVMENIYRWELAGPLGSAKLFFARALDVSRSCEVFALAAPRSARLFDAQVEMLDQLLR